MTVRWPRDHALATLGCLLVLLGCSSSDGKGSSAGALCTQRGPECLASQMVCVSSQGTETCQACPVGQYAATANGCEAIPGTLIAHTFEPYSVDPGQELNGKCQSWTLNNDTEIWVNAVEMENNGAYHHSNWLFVPDTDYAGPDGTWTCSDRQYDELSAAIAGGVLFAQSTQAQKQVQKFPSGVAVRLPPHVRILGGTHILNTSTSPITTSLSMRLYTIARADVHVPLAPFRLSYLDLHIQPNAISNFTGECDVSAVIPNGTPGDLDMDLYYVMPHYHALGHSFNLERFGGSNDGEVLYDLGQFDHEAHSKTFDPPVSMRNSQGFRFTCGFQNPYSVEVGWGVGDVASDPTAGEMCVMLGFQRSNYAFDGHVLPPPAGTNTLVSQSNGVYNYSYTCGVLPIDYTAKQGGL